MDGLTEGEYFLGHDVDCRVLIGGDAHGRVHVVDVIKHAQVEHLTLFRDKRHVQFLV